MSIKLCWENVEEILSDDNEDLYEELCEKSKPSDFYFYAKNSTDVSGEVFTDIVITPKAFYDKSGHFWDQHMNIEHILPDDFENLMEGIWSSERTIKEIKQDMIARGFEEKKV